MRQLSLLRSEQSEHEVAGDELMDAVRSAVKRVGPKEVCFALDIQLSTLSNALAERDGRHFPARWLAVVDRLDTEHEVLRSMAAPAGLGLVEIETRTAEEQLNDLKAVLLRQGEVGRQLLGAARVKP